MFVNQRSSAVSAAQKTGHSSDFDHDPGLHKPKCLDGGRKFEILREQVRDRAVDLKFRCGGEELPATLRGCLRHIFGNQKFFLKNLGWGVKPFRMLQFCSSI